MRADVINGDCLIEMPKLIEGGVKVDLVFTSPPYNLGTTPGGGFPARHGPNSKSAKWSGGLLSFGYGLHNDAMPHTEYVRWQKRVLWRCWNLLSDKGAIFYNHKPRVLGGRLIAPMDYVPKSLRPFVRQEIIWARAGGINFSPSFYCPTHERIIIIAKPDWRLRDKAASGAGDVWYVPQESGTDHPAPFPFELPKRAIETTGAKIVADPFCGSGTTGEATVSAGGEFYGIELEPYWADYARARISRAQGQWAEIPKRGNDITLPLFG